MSKRGSLTIEAALILPLIIFVILTIGYFMRIAYIHSIIQHAIDDSAKEISSYSYLYSVSKLQDINDKGEDALESTESTAVSRIDTVVDTVNSMSEKIDHIGNKIDEQDKTDYEDIKGICKDGKADIDKLKSIYDEIKGHPNGWKGGIKKEVVSLSALAAHGLFESGKKELA
ncbi:MAG: pilus assembly protein, partial [Bacillota bacterium]|nr:pilus assembly protein [Bacillota bacterium]